MAKTSSRTIKVPASPSVVKTADGWAYKATNGKYYGGFESRDAARKARDARMGAAPEGAETEQTKNVTETADAACNQEAAGVGSESKSESSDTAPGGNVVQITLNLVRTNKSGGSLYQQTGSSASVRFPKSLFAGAPPASITMDAPDGTFTAPGAAKVKVTTEEQAAKIRANAEKAAARAAKAQARAEKAAAKAAALTPAPAAQ